MNGHHWQVWTEGFVNFRSTDNDGEQDGARYNTVTVECEGSHAKCLKYYRQHGGAVAGLHLGYTLED